MTTQKFVLHRGKASALSSGAATISFDAHTKRGVVRFVVNGPDMDKTALQADYRNATRKLKSALRFQVHLKGRDLVDG